MKKDDGKSAPPEGSREAKLAQALRANLRRRKAATPTPAKPPKQS
jgi:hypothetical protein